MALQTNRAALECEVTDLRKQVEVPKTIWNMKKAELVEKAYEELSLPRAKAEEKTVIVLREMLRRNRQLIAVQADPMAVIPKGLNNMKLDDLKAVMAERNLPLGDRTTRPSMILAIREHVETFQLLTAAPDPHQLPQEEWEDVMGMDTDMPQPKSKAKSKGKAVARGPP